jgi:hypothetical protein
MARASGEIRLSNQADPHRKRYFFMAERVFSDVGGADAEFFAGPMQGGPATSARIVFSQWP